MQGIEAAAVTSRKVHVAGDGDLKGGSVCGSTAIRLFI
jgi:hypothetical protein